MSQYTVKQKNGPMPESVNMILSFWPRLGYFAWTRSWISKTEILMVGICDFDGCTRSVSLKGMKKKRQ